MKIERLEVLRGISCLIVIISHIRITYPYFLNPKFDYLQLFTAWGREAVILFFILSGIVIHISVQNNFEIFNFLKRRILRIYPVYWLTILLSVVITLFIGKEHIKLEIVIGNLLTLQTEPAYLFRTIYNNNAVWSISCEIFFYFVFGLFYLKKWNIAIWLLFSILAIVATFFKISDLGLYNHITYLLALSFIWIVGYYIYEFRNRFYVKMPTAILSISMLPLLMRIHTENIIFFTLRNQLLSIILIPFFLYLIQKEGPYKENKLITVRYSHYFIIYVILAIFFHKYSKSTPFNQWIYLLLPIFSALLFFKKFQNILKTIYKLFKNTLLFTANISYSLYIIHMPIMYLASFIFPNQPVAWILFSLVTCLSASLYLELRFQRFFILNKKLTINPF